MVEMAMFNVQTAISPKIGKPELLFMCSTCCIMMIYICVKFCKISEMVSNLQSRHEYMV